MRKSREEHVRQRNAYLHRPCHNINPREVECLECKKAQFKHSNIFDQPYGNVILLEPASHTTQCMHVRARHQHDAQADASCCERARGREGRGGDVTAGTHTAAAAAAAANDTEPCWLSNFTNLSAVFFKLICSSLIHLEKQLSTSKLLPKTVGQKGLHNNRTARS